MTGRQLALLCAAAMVTTPAAAASTDLFHVTCRDFLTAGKEDIGYTLAWLDGYYADKRRPPVINSTQFIAKAKKLAEFCAANPTVSLIKAGDKLFGRK